MKVIEVLEVEGEFKQVIVSKRFLFWKYMVVYRRYPSGNIMRFQHPENKYYPLGISEWLEVKGLFDITNDRLIHKTPLNESGYISNPLSKLVGGH